MTALSLIGDGIVADRLRRVAAPHRVVTRDVDGDVVVVARGGPHAELVAELVAAGRHVISTSGSLTDVRQLLDLDRAARDAGVSVVVGAAVSPGLSGMLARHLADRLARCDELHIAVHGTGGPACAREHHAMLSGWAVGWHDGAWLERIPAGSGRELCWFPEPVGARDCYRAESPDPLVLQRVFPDVDRISVRVSAARRDRLTARLPMLSPPHREGGIGALRVEARGADASGARVTLIWGIAELAATAAAAVAASFVDVVAAGRTEPGVVVAGDAGLPTGDLLAGLGRRGVRLQSFTGLPS
ncbi:MAG: hypothetical protein ACK5OX_19155 [Desertimonas sp.]